MAKELHRGPDLASLSAIDALTMLQELAEVLWWDDDKQCWNNEKEWNSDTTAAIGDVFEEHGFVPTLVANTKMGRKFNRTRQVPVIEDVEHKKP